MSEILGIIALTIVAPIWIVSHYLTKWKLSKGLSKDEALMLEDLWKTAQAMENRVKTLEAILDDNVKGWRNNA
ncbi:MAG: envelope stress response membrane protein PspB [Gammaproteobacteria bacterium]|jgi:phage shock protein B|nr:envelope stress response membrane protein PspB [Gammaproteobacteria bacterium]